MISRRPTGRRTDEIRPISIETRVNLYAEGSALIKTGNTHVLCTASVDEKVPDWIGNKDHGWVTAEYSMLPRSTHTRTRRDRDKMSGRTQEIQRLIGRALRAMVDLKKLGPRTIIIDCDVLQADGGTRTASITGACVALALALDKLAKAGKLPGKAWVDTVAAVSVGIVKGEIFADMDYEEDSACEVDMNFVVTGKNQFVELQGTAEHKPFSKNDMLGMTDVALNAIEQLKKAQHSALKTLDISL